MMLIIDSHFEKELQRIKNYAEHNPFSLDQMKRFVSGEADPNEKEFQCKLPIGFDVTLTIEHQPSMGGMVRHMSMCTDRKGKLPDPETVKIVMPYLGFVNNLENCTVFEHEDHINVLEPIK
jgi:hypothetical protein